MNNTTILAADRTTHLKVVAISLVASIVVTMIAMLAHPVPAEGVRVADDAPGLAARAGQPYLTSRSDITAIR
jgi:hypothetical protein